MRRVPWGALALAGLLALAGCGGAGGGKGTVTGKVTYKGKALPGGRVTFTAANKQNVVADIKDDGTYTAQDVPAGPAKITVHTEYLKQQGQPRGARSYAPPKDQKAPEGYQMGGDPAAAKHYVKIPDQYQDPDTSGLTYDVKKGDQTHDIPLQ